MSSKFNTAQFKRTTKKAFRSWTNRAVGFNQNMQIQKKKKKTWQMWHPFINCFTVSQHCARAKVSDTSDWRIYRLCHCGIDSRWALVAACSLKADNQEAGPMWSPRRITDTFEGFENIFYFLAEATSAGTSKVNCKEGKHSPAAFRMKKKWFCSDTRKILWSEISKLEPKLLQQIVFRQIGRSVVKLVASGLLGPLPLVRCYCPAD